ncbi:MAG: cytosine permease [Chloroflexi bacterium]|nr:cytosine permease [Chloroflexota bacterium]
MPESLTFQERFQDYALEPVPDAKRRGLFSSITVFCGWVVTTTPFLVAGLLAAGLTFGQALLVLLLGTVITATVGALVAYLGQTTGLTAYYMSRIVYGAKGSSVVSVMVGVLAVGFLGVVASFLGAIFNADVPVIPSQVASVVFILISGFVALVGYRGLSIVGRAIVPLLWALALFALWRVSVAAGGLDHVLGIQPKGTLDFGLAVTIVVADWITGATFCADIARYSKRPRNVVVAAYMSWVLTYCLLATMALVAYYGTGTSDVIALLTQLGLVIAALFIFVLGLITSVDVNLYSFSLALTNLSDAFGLRQLGRPVWIVVGAILSALISLLGYAETFLPFLLTVGTLIPAFAGVVLAHYYILGARRRSAAELIAHIEPGVRWTGIISLVGGVAVAYFIKAGIPALQGLVAAAVLYTVLEFVYARVMARAIEESPRLANS